MKYRDRYLSNVLCRDFALRYFGIVKECKSPGMALVLAVKSKAPSWYVSRENAMRTLRSILCGKYVRLSENKRRQFTDMAAIVKQLSLGGLPFNNAVDTVLQQHAPQFYISLRTARYLIRKYLQTKRI